MKLNALEVRSAFLGATPEMEDGIEDSSPGIGSPCARHTSSRCCRRDIDACARPRQRCRGRGVPVVLSRKDNRGRWVEIAKSRADDNGRVRSFGDAARFTPGVYRLHFDMTGYPQAGAQPFFPEIDLVFRVTDAAGHYHVPVVVSPFGYSTYRGN